jgi:hypothetical protein
MPSFAGGVCWRILTVLCLLRSWKAVIPFYSPIVFREAGAPVFGETTMTRRVRSLRWKISNALPQMIPEKSEFPACPICNGHVNLESAKVDENGHAMHEECYLLRLHMEQQDKSA